MKPHSEHHETIRETSALLADLAEQAGFDSVDADEVRERLMAAADSLEEQRGRLASCSSFSWTQAGEVSEVSSPHSELFAAVKEALYGTRIDGFCVWCQVADGDHHSDCEGLVAELSLTRIEEQYQAALDFIEANLGPVARAAVEANSSSERE